MEEIERLKSEIARIKAQTSDIEPPVRIPTTAEHYETYNRIYKAVRPLLVRYAKIVNEHNVVPDIKTDKLEQYTAELNVLWTVDDEELRFKRLLLGFGLHAIIKREELSKYEILRRIHTAITETEGRR